MPSLSIIKNIDSTTLNHYLNPSSLTPSLKPKVNGAKFGLCFPTNLTVNAGKIQNSAVRIFAQLFGLIIDTTGGILATPLWNMGAVFHKLYATLKNRSIEKTNQNLIAQAKNKWNPTALKTWGVIASVLGLAIGVSVSKNAIGNFIDKNIFSISPTPQNTSFKETAITIIAFCVLAFVVTAVPVAATRCLINRCRGKEEKCSESKPQENKESIDPLLRKSLNDHEKEYSPENLFYEGCFQRFRKNEEKKNLEKKNSEEKKKKEEIPPKNNELDSKKIIEVEKKKYEEEEKNKKEHTKEMLKKVTLEKIKIDNSIIENKNTNT
jgi:hypothetical protein